MKKYLSPAIFLLFSISSLSAQPRSITILHTNDMHASFIPHEAFWVRENPKPLVGGFNELSFALDSIKKVKSAVLILDAGDVMTGNPITEYSYQETEGGALFAMMNMIGYDAWTYGNHDLDISQENLAKLIAIARFPSLNANVRNSKGENAFQTKPYTLFERNGLKVGVIGIMTQGLYNLVNQNNLEGLRVESPVEVTQRFVNELRPQCDLVIALTHQGVDEDSVLAAKVTGLDVIVGGHSHTRLRKPKVVNSTIIVQAGSNCENLGILDLTVDGKKIIASNGNLLPLNFTSARPATQLSRFIDSIQNVITQDYSEVLGTLRTDWIRGEGQYPLGWFITEAQREAAQADVAFTNNHGIRKNLLAGPVTKKDLFEVLPFRNVLVTFQLSGKEIQDILTRYLSRGSSIQIAGIDCTWKKEQDGTVMLQAVKINGKNLDPNTNYIGAASDYFVGEADRYLGMPIAAPQFSRTTVFSAVEKKIRATKVLETSELKHFQEIQ